MKYDPQATYVLIDNEGYIRILCEAENASYVGFEGNVLRSQWSADLETIKTLVKECEYKIVQEWK